MFKRKKIPQDDAARFLALSASPQKLKRETPLMPVFQPSGFRATLRAMKRIKTLPPGTSVHLEAVKMNGVRAWYKVTVKDSLVSGWINSLHFPEVI